MAYEYASVHLKFTIPLALALSLAIYPVTTRAHIFQIASLVAIAFFATLPWDAYLIRHGVWTYPEEAIIGPRAWGIPIEELFFFVIQTYITSCIYILANKPVIHALYLGSQRNPPSWMKRAKLGGQVTLMALALLGACLIKLEGRGTYLGLILAWAAPFTLITWTVAGRFILSLPWTSTALPIVLPTVYLWLVDELALGRGTWSIESGTKLGLCLFGVLEMEEAVFFLATNMLIVFGLAVFDQYLAIIFAFPHIFPTVTRSPTPLMLVESRLLDSSKFDLGRLQGIADAVHRLKRKSRSFYLANALFSGRLRIDLILLYSFCRVADDLVDNAVSRSEVLSWTSKLKCFLDLRFKENESLGHPPRTPTRNGPRSEVDSYVDEAFPDFARSPLHLLPANVLPPEPLYSLIEGFETDSLFSSTSEKETIFPIADEQDLAKYAHRVAGTVGELCVALILHHCEPEMDQDRQMRLRSAACQMGVALQYVNIARDIVVDARMGRVYLPTTWLKEAGLAPEAVIEHPRGPVVAGLRRHLLDRAFLLYRGARETMDLLPSEARGPMVAAVETYMEIGRVLSETDEFNLREGKATVPTTRRVRTALNALFKG
ncbi:Phytoene synthase [Lasiosphaeria ovina]|uniref:Bifunctional lycopene cyclase/phytoene synthase n=1 Tax=Lasiosphaeria ovina TaxID=92902 RepID=A0AAE0NL97_9PEZI|nr:Phytoene synthase [Lasiosphaeria ovina]